MTQEEKAKAYDEAIERAESIYNETAIPSATTKGICTYIFPELKESEDERIRKGLIEGFQQYDEEECWRDIEYLRIKDIIAWLEKQNEQKPILNVPTREVILAIWELGNEWKELTNGSILTEYGSQLKYIQDHWRESEYYPKEKQDEQKPANKVKPKFKVGDWITNGAAMPAQISSIEDGLYFTHNGTLGGDIESIDKEYHLWTIQDAKKGDVLVYRGKTEYEKICLFNNLNNAFFTLLKTSNVEEYGIDVNVNYPNNTVPATKEQKEILFMVMKDAGYEFDFEKKELKKIEQKPVNKVKSKFKHFNVIPK